MRQIPGRLSLRVLLFLGFTGIFLLWLVSAYVFVQRMVEADGRGAAIRSRFLRNEQLLSTVRAQTLLSSVYLRDAVFDTTTAPVTDYQQRLYRIREAVEQALVQYVPRVDSEPERVQWRELQNELAQYWNSTMPVLALERTPSADEARRVLREEIIPKRETIIRISDGIHAVNQHAFEQEQAELAALRQGLRRRVWQTSTITVFLGLGIAFMATRYAGRLESRIREQHTQELHQKRELERLSSQLMQAQEEERRRIARELHDEIGQALTALKLELAIAERSGSTPQASPGLSEARAITDRALQSVRDMSQLLHPSMLDDLGLPDTATWYLRGFSRRTGITSELVVDRLDGRLDPDVESCTYRIIQEALTNVARHAEASQCRVVIAHAGAVLRVRIEDDGKGFEASDPAPAERGLGLVGVRERVTRLGGTMKVESRRGIGTSLMVELPVPAVKAI
jgi:signal transduction histidine kinase